MSTKILPLHLGPLCTSIACCLETGETVRRFEVFTAMKIQFVVFRVVTPRSDMWYPTTSIRGVTTQKTTTWRGNSTFTQIFVALYC